MAGRGSCSRSANGNVETPDSIRSTIATSKPSAASSCSSSVDAALDDDIGRAIVAAQLLDIHRDQEFVLEDEDPQPGKYRHSSTGAPNGGHDGQ